MAYNLLKESDIINYLKHESPKKVAKIIDKSCNDVSRLQRIVRECNVRCSEKTHIQPYTHRVKYSY